MEAATDAIYAYFRESGLARPSLDEGYLSVALNHSRDQWYTSDDEDGEDSEDGYDQGDIPRIVKREIDMRQAAPQLSWPPNEEAVEAL